MSRESIDWLVPKYIIKSFREEYSKEVEIGQVGDHAETAMLEFSNADRYADFEAVMDDLLSSSGVDLEAVEQDEPARYPTGGDASQIDVEMYRFTARVNKDTKNEFRKFSDENYPNEQYGYVLGRALYAYMNDPRPDRLERKLRRLLWMHGGEA